jgi:hypothetical protein
MTSAIRRPPGRLPDASGSCRRQGRRSIVRLERHRTAALKRERACPVARRSANNSAEEIVTDLTPARLNETFAICKPTLTGIGKANKHFFQPVADHGVRES